MRCLNGCGQPDFTASDVATRGMGLGYIASVSNHSSQYYGQHQNQFAQNQQGNHIRGTGNELGRAQRNQSSGCPTVRLLQVQLGSDNNKEKKKQTEGSKFWI